MITIALAVLCGGAWGLAVAAVVAATRRWYPRLEDGLAALDERGQPSLPRPGGGQRFWSLAARRLPAGVETTDLRLLGLRRDEFMAKRLASTVGCAFTGPALALALSLIDAELPPMVFLAASVAAAWAAWAEAARRVRDRADSARDEMRYALVAYLQQASLLRHGGAGVATAMEQPAAYLDTSWAMQQIAHHLQLASRSGRMPWHGLQRLADDIDLPELDDIADIARAAGDDGGAVLDTLLARATSLADELRADSRAEANRASTRMSTPGAIQVFLIAAWVLFPATTALLSS